MTGPDESRPGIEIVPADEGSVPAFVRLHAAAFDEAWDTGALSQVLSMSGAFALMAVERQGSSSEPLGFLIARLAADEGEILTLAVTPGHRRKGLARRLMEAAAAAILVAGGTALFLEVAEDNLPATMLYEHLGFRQVGLRPGYYPRSGGAVSARTLRLDLAPKP